MGMGTIGISIVTITHEDLKKVCKKELNALEKAVENCEENNSMDLFMQEFSIPECPEGVYTTEEFEILNDLLEKLKLAFTEIYPGLHIEPYFHYTDNGDRYDEFFGGRWEVIGAWKKTPMAQKLEKKIGKNKLDFQMITTFG